MRVSNVDKHTKPGETPVRLCNYVDVYKNDTSAADELHAGDGHESRKPIGSGLTG